MNFSPMLQTHPHQSTFDMSKLVDCVTACYECAFSCNACADACLGEENVHQLVRCIRLNLDCADICESTGHVVSRMTETDMSLTRAQVQACIEACRLCGAECEKHARMHEHCQVCAEACRRCQQACEVLLNAVPA